LYGNGFCVVLSNLYNVECVAVDTHVERVSKRLCERSEQSGLQGSSPCPGGGGGLEALRELFGAVENKPSSEARRSSPQAIFLSRFRLRRRSGRAEARLSSLRPEDITGLTPPRHPAAGASSCTSA
jgi:hypothetical protein